MEKSKYYTPNMDEFKPGFKFEYLSINDYRFGIIDFSGDRDFEEVSKYHSENWIDCICDWKYASGEVFIAVIDNIKLKYSGATRNSLSQFDDNKIIKLVEDGRIRAKIDAT